MNGNIEDETVLDPINSDLSGKPDIINLSIIYSPLIPLILLLLSYPFWENIEEVVGFKNKSNDFFVSNFFFIFTLIISSLNFIIFPKLVRFNDTERLETWENDSPGNERIYLMNPFELERHDTLAGKIIAIIMFSNLIGAIIISISFEFVIFFSYIVFDTNISIVVLFISLIYLIIIVVQGYIVFGNFRNVIAIYLHENRVVLRSAYIFGSFWNSYYEIDNIPELFVKEHKPLFTSIPFHYLKFKVNRWSETSLAFSDDYEKIVKLKLDIENYLQTATQAES